MKRTSFLDVSYKRYVVFIELFNFSFFSITDQGIDLGYCDIEWFALETNKDHSVVFEIASKYCISDSFVDHDGHSISSKGFLPTVVDIMVTWVRGSGQEELPHAPMPEQGVAVGRSNRMPETRGSGREDQPHVQGAVAAWAQEGLEELSCVEGQEGWRWGDIPRPR